MSEYLEVLQNSIVATIVQKVPELKQCQIAPDDNFAAIAGRLPVVRPAVFVSMSKADINQRDGALRLIFNTNWTALVLSELGKNYERYNQCRDLAIAVSWAVERETFGEANVQPARVQDIASSNLDIELAKSSTMWEVNWTQMVYLEKLTSNICH